MKKNLWIKRIFALSLIAIFTVGVIYHIEQPPPLKKSNFKKFNDFDSFYQYRLKISKKDGVKDNNEERLIRIKEKKKTQYAILYIHGFLASRAEGEYVVDRIASRYHMNAYYLRLPGHGTNMIDHASKNYRDYLQVVEQALYHMQFLGEKIIIMATSTGGVLSFYLASQYPKKIHSMVVASPFLDFSDASARVMYYPGGIELVSLLYGDIRKAQMDPNDSRYNYNEYKKYWYIQNKFEAFRALVELRSSIFRPEVLSKIKSPLLLLVYPEDEVASAESMRKAFHMMPPKNKYLKEIKNGNHILFSEYVKSDKEKIFIEIDHFFRHMIIM